MAYNISGGDTHLEDDSGDSEGIVLAKVVAMIVLSLATFILGMLPIKLAKWFRWGRSGNTGLDTSPRSQLILSLLLCFGGGALLCTTFLHMLPEVREAITDLQGEGEIGETNFHLPELIMCCGFFTMYLVEELVHLYLHWKEDSKEDDVIHRSFSVRKCSEIAGSRGSEDVLSAYSTQTLTTTLDDTEKNIQDPKPVPLHHLPVPNKDDTIVTSVRGLLIVLALSIHELFEGLAVGLQTSTGFVWYMLGAVSAHKLVIAFCVGVELVSSGTKFILTLIYIATFALVSPLGIGIGLGLSEGSGDGALGGVPNAVLQGLATGTLLYVVFFEVLQRSHDSRHQSGLKKLLAIMVGFGLMFGILVAVGHNHSHEHEHVHDHTDDHIHDHTHGIETAVTESLKAIMRNISAHHDH